jgi:nucleotide-binding universal stress UspA family protein
MRWPWRDSAEPPPVGSFAGKSILLASEGRPIPRTAVEFAGRMAQKAGAEVHVLSIARIWGTSFGLPHPGLMPNKQELRQQQESVASAITWLKRQDIAVSGEVCSTRNATKRILAETRRRRADAIVMASDAPQHWLISGMIWSQEPYRVRKKASVPVYLVVDAAKADTR